jgi:hypothetical protein
VLAAILGDRPRTGVTRGVSGWSGRVSVLAAAVGLLGASGASATTLTFSTPGCSSQALPAGLTSVAVTATGSAGGTGLYGAAGGSGDVVAGTLTGLSPTGQTVYVCVNVNGGAAPIGVGENAGAPGGVGGGASGVALGTSSLGMDFLNPVLIAAGGGGGGGYDEGGMLTNVGVGGDAGDPNGAAGTNEGASTGGGGGSQTGAGPAGIGSGYHSNSGGPGAPSDGAGPGSGGVGALAAYAPGPYAPAGGGGGGGGGGYYGGGGGGGGSVEASGAGGGGGSDFCATTLTGASLSGCGVTGANLVFGTASVTVSWRTAPTIVWADPAAITYGTPLSATQLNATASVAGSFVYTPPAGSVLNAGAHQTLSVAFTPTDTADYANASATVPITVLQAPTKLSAPVLSLGVIAASLTRSDTDAAVAGEKIVFATGTTTLCSAMTNTEGVASCNMSPANAAVALLFGYRANFAGDPNYLASSASAGP